MVRVNTLFYSGDEKDAAAAYPSVMLLIALAAAPIAACTNAVHQLGTIPPAQIVAACSPPPGSADKLWSAGGPSAACVDALEAGRTAAQASTLPPNMRAGVMRDFDARAAKCAAAPASPGDRQRMERLDD